MLQFMGSQRAGQQYNLICFLLVPRDIKVSVTFLPLTSGPGWLVGWFSHYVVSNSCDPMDFSLPGSFAHGMLQARILECHFHFQGIFLTQESDLGLLHCRQILYQLSYEGSQYIYNLEVYLEFSSLFMEAEKFHNLLPTRYKARKASGIIQSQSEGL